MEPIVLCPHKSRFVKFFKKDDREVPSELFRTKNEPVGDITLKYPLPFRLRDCRICLRCGDVVWLGSDRGVARYCENEKDEYDRVMYFSAERYLQDNKVLSFIGSENELWVMTETSVSHIELKEISAEEKARILLDETLSVVERQGMASNRTLLKPWDMSSRCPFANSDNDGGFTASLCIGEMLHYAVLKREKGELHPETQNIRKIAMHFLEACMLLMFISGRNDGFVARTYLTSDAPVPDDGLFFRKKNGVAAILETTYTKHSNIVGIQCDASAEIPERLAAVYRDLGYGDDDIIFKGDTSSDEITLHVMNLYYGHMVFGDEDPELDSIIKQAISGLVDHIIDNGYELIDYSGKPTTWARWSIRYFSDGIGWGDAPINAAEALMYLKVAMYICGENKKWKDAYNYLLEKKYHLLPELHYERAFAGGICMGCEVSEDIMYGDHMLANLSFFGLMMLESDEYLKECYYKGWRSWRDTSIAREHHPIYDIPFAVACPNDFVDGEKLALWFNRNNVSRLAAGCNVTDRADVPSKEYIAGYKQTSYLLPPDERAISKYDKDPLKFVNEKSGGKYTVETCSPYTMSYWMGRFYGLVKESGTDE